MQFQGATQDESRHRGQTSASQTPPPSMTRYGLNFNEDGDGDGDGFTRSPPPPPPPPPLVSGREHQHHHHGNVHLPRDASPFPRATPPITTSTTAATTQDEGDAVLRAISETSDRLVARLEALAAAYRNFDGGAANGGAGCLVQRLIEVQRQTAASAIFVFGETLRQAVEDHLCDGGDDSGQVGVGDEAASLI